MRTLTPLVGSVGQNTAVQLGSANTASLTSRPTLRASMSNAATTARSVGP